MSIKKPRQVWLLNHYAQEPGYAGGTRHFSLARHFADSGWEASIIAASVELNTGRQRLARGQVSATTEHGDVRFLWLQTPQYHGNGIGRLWNMIVYSVRAMWPSLTDDLPRPDIVVGSSVHPFAAWSAAKIAKRIGVPFVFEVRDLWPQTLIDLGRLSEGSLITKLFQKLEKSLYLKASKIIVLLPRATEYIEPLGVPNERICWIPNGVDITSTFETSSPKKSEYFTFMYFGAHGNANGLETVLRAMQLLGEDPALSMLRLRLIGDGPNKPQLEALANSLQLSNVFFENPVAKSDIPKIASQADAFVFNLVDAPVFKFGISSNKLFDFLAAARPVVFCCNATNNPVEDAGAGLTVPSGNTAKLAAAMASLARMPQKDRIRMGRSGRNYVIQHHDYSVLAKKFCRVLDSVVDRPNESGRQFPSAQ